MPETVAGPGVTVVLLCVLPRFLVLVSHVAGTVGSFTYLYGSGVTGAYSCTSSHSVRVRSSDVSAPPTACAQRAETSAEPDTLSESAAIEFEAMSHPSSARSAEPVTFSASEAIGASARMQAVEPSCNEATARAEVVTGSLL